MQGKILVIDAISTKRIVLKVKLTGAFYQVAQAATLDAAVQAARAAPPDLIITAMDLPDGDAAALCTRLRSLPTLANVPVLAIGTQRDAGQRLATLAAGAVDVMLHPLSDTLLLGRVRSCIRIQNALSEWQMREETSCALGLAEPAPDFAHASRISLIGDDLAALKTWGRRLSAALPCTLSVTCLRDALASQHSGKPADVIVVCLPRADAPAAVALRLISELRASALTRQCGVLVVSACGDEQRMTTALDLGADDVMGAGFEPEEIALRLSALLRRKRLVERVQQTVRTGLHEVVHDPLTGLYNRRYAMPHMARVLARAARMGQTAAVLVGDMDHFKTINDRYGHAAGDAVLQEAARRLQREMRGFDTVARIGGEEFLILLPTTSPACARRIGERLRDAIAATPFSLPGGHRPVRITMSFGLALSGGGRDEAPEDLLARADKALYAAKTRGRNQVECSVPQKRPAA
ncbi:diguanylate cyclase [Sulfitobacter albidus]|uniref:diguanylate cyclase n=1 Tax=Sulfitobacter albidus TaxID=2829501 RepID=A0A975JB56_9RHOB|nr:diguanylate cyclase [Sulfitobacter albidus]QUJ75234.1 diguanylate cyclase [Sulfitobacter albidus]